MSHRLKTYEYSAFGEPLIASGELASSFTHQFSTKPYCAVTGFSEYQMRKYRPEIGRWMSRDPIFETSWAKNDDFEIIPQALSYGYLSNSAISKYDYLGLHTRSDCEVDKDFCDARCRSLPRNDRRKRALCWSKCMAKYAACIATCQETLISVGCGVVTVIIVVTIPGGEILIPITL